MKIKLIVAHIGYAETSFASSLAFLNVDSGEYGSPLDAVQDLADCILFKYFEKYGDDYMDALLKKQCCLDAKSNDSYCSTCGSRLPAKISIDIEDFSNYISDMLVQHMDGYGSVLLDFGSWTEFGSWSEFLDIPKDQVIEIEIYAERVIALALTGSEFNDTDHEYHHLSESLQNAVKEYWENGNNWIQDNPRCREGLNNLLLKYRLSSISEFL